MKKDFVLLDTREHLLILEAIKAGDPERSAAAVFVHIINSKERILQALEKRD